MCAEQRHRVAKLLLTGISCLIFQIGASRAGVEDLSLVHSNADVGEGSEIRVKVTGTTFPGYIGAIVRDNDDSASAFVFAGRNAAGEIVVIYRREAGGPVETVIEADSGSQWTWFRLLVGTDTVYVYRSTTDFDDGAGSDVWNATSSHFLRAVKIDLTGADWGGTVAENGSSGQLVHFTASNPLIWAERSARAADSGVTTTGTWVLNNAPAEVTESDSVFEHDGTGTQGYVQLPLPINQTGDYEVFIHYVKGSALTGDVDIHFDDVGGNPQVDQITYQFAPGAESVWIRSARYRMTAGSLDNFVRIHSVSGELVKADAVRAVYVPEAGWKYPGWTGFTRVSWSNNWQSNNKIQRNKPNNIGWNAGARSTRVLLGDGAYQFRVPSTNYRVKVGLSASPWGSDSNILHHIYAQTSPGKWKATGAPSPGGQYYYGSNPKFTIERIGGIIRYRHNGAIYEVSGIPTTAPLYLDCSIRDYNGRFINSRVQGWFNDPSLVGNLDQDVFTDSVELGIIDSNIEDDIQNYWDVNEDDDFDNDGQGNYNEVYRDWTDPADPGSVAFFRQIWFTDMVNTFGPVTTEPYEGSSLIKTAGGNAWNADGVSQWVMPEDGELRFEFGQTNQYIMIGLSAENTDQSWESIDFKVYGGASGIFYIYDGTQLVYQSPSGAYTQSDEFAIERSDGIFKVWKNSKNGSPIYETSIRNRDWLRVDSSIYSQGAGVNDVRQVGFYGVEELSNGFEVSEGFQAGTLDGQNGWSASPGVTVSSTAPAEGALAAELSGNGSGMSYSVSAYSPYSETELTVNIPANAEFLADPGLYPEEAATLVSFDPALGLVAFDGDGAGGGAWVVVDDTVQVGDNVTVRIQQDNVAKTWRVLVNDLEYPNPLHFKDNTIATTTEIGVINRGQDTIHVDGVNIKGVTNP